MMLRKKILEKLKVRQAEDELDDYSHYESGLELARQGRHGEAIIEFKRAAQSGDNAAESLLAIGLAHEKLGREGDAILAFSEAIKARPDFTEGYTKLGLAFDRSGQFLKAIRMHLNAIRLAPHVVELRRNLGMAYFNVGSYAEAIKAFTQALQIDEEDGSVRYCLGLVYLDLKDQESARQQHQLIKELGDLELAAKLMVEIDRQVLSNAATRSYATPDDADDEPIIGKS
jgi:tetratricopeptide (TPR) repeat protein